MSKRQVAIDIMDANPKANFAELVELVGKANGLDTASAKSYVRWIAANGKSKAHGKDALKVWASEKPVKAPKEARAPKSKVDPNQNWLVQNGFQKAPEKVKEPKAPKEKKEKAPKPQKIRIPKDPKKLSVEEGDAQAAARAKNLQLIKEVGARVKKMREYQPGKVAGPGVPGVENFDADQARAEVEAILADTTSTDRVNPVFNEGDTDA
jgi:hypothetical protein